MLELDPPAAPELTGGGAAGADFGGAGRWIVTCVGGVVAGREMGVRRTVLTLPVLELVLGAGELAGRGPAASTGLKMSTLRV